jgi:hypothetical protein
MSIMYWSLQRPQQLEIPEKPEPSCAISDASSDIASEDYASHCWKIKEGAY